MQLFLVRHGDSPFAATSDHLRPLSTLGREQAFQAGRYIKKHYNGIHSQIICSDANRTLQTAAIIAQVLNTHSINSDQLFYHAKVGDWCDAIIEYKTNEMLILVGHNPTISFLSNHLHPKHQFSFSPACVAHYELEIAEDGLKLPAQYKDFFTPNE